MYVVIETYTAQYKYDKINTGRYPTVDSVLVIEIGDVRIVVVLGSESVHLDGEVRGKGHRVDVEKYSK